MCAAVLLSGIALVANGSPGALSSSSYGSQSAVATAPMTAPGVIIVTPVDSSYNSTGNVTVRWSYNIPMDHFEVSLDEATAVNVGTVAETTYDPLEDGVHVVTVTGYFAVGGSLSDTVTFTVDTTNPTLSIAHPVVGAWYNDTTMNVTWSASDAGSGIHNTSIRLDEGAWSEASTNYSEFTGLAEGQHSISVRVIDNAGNERTSNKTFNIYTTLPGIEIISPEDGYLLNSSTLITMAATWEANSAADIANYWVAVDEGSWVDVDLSTSYSLADLSQGEHTLKVKVSDYAGNMNSTSISIMVDSIAPAVSFTAPAEGAYLLTNDVTVSWTVQEDGSGVRSTNFYIDNRDWEFMPDDIDPPNVVTFSSLQQGSHTVVVRVTDDADNYEDAILTFVVDSIAPTVIGSPIGDDEAVTTAIGAVFSEAMDKDSVSITITGVSGTITWSDNTATFTPSAALAYDTEFTVNVQGRDLAGHEVSYSWTFTTMKNVGTVSGTVRGPDGKWIDNATVTLSNGQVTTTDSNGHFEFTSVASGNYTLEITKAGFPAVTQNVEAGAGQESDLGTINLEASTPTTDGDGSNGTILLASAGVLVVAMVAFLLLAGRRLRK